MKIAEKRVADNAEVLMSNASDYSLNAGAGAPAPKAPSQGPIIVSGAQKKPRYLGTLVSRNIVVAGHRTSVRLEPEMWDGLREICRRERLSLHQICTSVSLQKPDRSSLTASIRVFVMRYFRNAATEDGHSKAGHSATTAYGMGSMGGGDAFGKSVVPLTRTSFA